MDFKPEKRGIPIGAILLAAVFTLATFILLPALEVLRERSGGRLELRSVETLTLEPPPPPLQERIEPPSPPEKSATPKPRLEERMRRIPLNAVLDLDFGISEVGGDFALDFDVFDAVGAGIEQSIFELSDIDQNPTAIVKTPPIYPMQAKMRRIEGEVVLQFVVDADGEVRDIEIVESAPGDVFNQTARRAVARWRFQPGIKDEQPVAVRVRQKLKFRLDR